MRKIIWRIFLMANNLKPICVVQSAESVKPINNIMTPNYIVCSYPNLVDLGDFNNRQVLLWPDNNPDSISAMSLLASKLSNSSVKIINLDGITPNSKPHQIISSKWRWSDLVKWAKARATPHNSVALVDTSKPSRAAESSNVEVLPPEYMQEVVPVDEYAMDESIEQAGDNAAFALWEDMKLYMNKKGMPFINSANVNQILLKQFKDRIWMDLFSNRIMTNLNPRWSNNKIDPESKYKREWGDSDNLELLNRLQIVYNLHSMTLSKVEEGVTLFANRNARDDVVTWLNSIQWDETPRIQTFLIDALGAKDTPYVRAASKNLWVAMAKRILFPGVKFDNMVILEGGQGIGKSTVLDIIGGKYFAENNTALDKKDFDVSLRGRLLIEFAELDFFRKADVDTLKRRLSQRVDRYRPHFGKHESEFPRRCVFVGTTNRDEYLNDETGGRRFWPVTCGRVNIKYVKEFREQFFAEARELALEDEPHWEMPVAETLQMQASRSEIDPRTPVVMQWLASRTTPNFYLFEVARHLGITDDKMRAPDRIQLGKILNSLGVKYKKTNKGNVYTIPRDIHQQVEESDSEIYGDTEVCDDEKKPLRSESEGSFFSELPENLPF
jgi:hypothetical protein